MVFLFTGETDLNIPPIPFFVFFLSERTDEPGEELESAFQFPVNE